MSGGASARLQGCELLEQRALHVEQSRNPSLQLPNCPRSTPDTTNYMPAALLLTIVSRRAECYVITVAVWIFCH